MLSRLSRTLVLLSCLLAACDSGSQPPSVAATPKSSTLDSADQEWAVLEAFDVGPDVYVRAIATDPRSNTLWVGTSVGALEVNLKTRDVLRTHTRAEGLANEYVFALAVDREGGTWFGTNGGGASRFYQSKWKTYFPMHGLADYWVYSFGEQANGAFWIGTWAGASRIDPVTGNLTNFVKELVNEWVYGIDVDSQDRVWFGTEGGVSMYDGKTWRAWTHADGLGAPNAQNLPPSTNTGLGTRTRHDLSLQRDGQGTYNPSYVFAVEVTQDNNVWAGTWGGGVARFDGKKWRNYTTAEGLSGNIVFSIAEDMQGHLWFGTDQGLTRFDGQRFQRFDQKNGITGTNIYSVAVAPNGEIWLGTRGSVMRFGLRPKSNASQGAKQ